MCSPLHALVSSLIFALFPIDRVLFVGDMACDRHAGGCNLLSLRWKARSCWLSGSRLSRARGPQLIRANATTIIVFSQVEYPVQRDSTWTISHSSFLVRGMMYAELCKYLPHLLRKLLLRGKLQMTWYDAAADGWSLSVLLSVVNLNVAFITRLFYCWVQLYFFFA